MKIIIGIFVLLGLIVILPVNADLPDQYGIALSRTCLTMLAGNITTDCPTYEQIDLLFPDTTDPLIAGDFIVIDGVYQRDTPPVKNPWRYYYYSQEPPLWLDPPSDARSRLVMITIEPSLPAYKIGDESKKMDDYTVSFQKDRWVDEKCNEASITAENWVFLTGDTINLMKHGCDKQFTSFDGTVSIVLVKSYQDIATSFKYKHDLWVKESLIKCKVKGC